MDEQKTTRAKNVGDRYFGGMQMMKKWLAVAIGLILLGLVLYELWWYNVIFLPLMWVWAPIPALVGVVMLVAQLTGRVSDSAYDEYMQGRMTQLWSEKSESEAALPDQTVLEYAILGDEVSRKKKGGDRKLRTDCLCRTELFFEPGALRVKLGRVCADGEGSLSGLSLPFERLTASLAKRQSAKLSGLEKTHLLLMADGKEVVSFPVPDNSYDMDALVEKIEHLHRRATA